MHGPSRGLCFTRGFLNWRSEIHSWMQSWVESHLWIPPTISSQFLERRYNFPSNLFYISLISDLSVSFHCMFSTAVGLPNSLMRMILILLIVLFVPLLPNLCSSLCLVFYSIPILVPLSRLDLGNAFWLSPSFYGKALITLSLILSSMFFVGILSPFHSLCSVMAFSYCFDAFSLCTITVSKFTIIIYHNNIRSLLGNLLPAYLVGSSPTVYFINFLQSPIFSSTSIFFSIFFFFTHLPSGFLPNCIIVYDFYMYIYPWFSSFSIFMSPLPIFTLCFLKFSYAFCYWFCPLIIF